MDIEIRNYSMQHLQSSVLPYGTFQAHQKIKISDDLFLDIPLVKPNVYSKQNIRFYSKSIDKTNDSKCLIYNYLPFISLTNGKQSFYAFVLDSINSEGKDCRLVSIIDNENLANINQYNKRSREEDTPGSIKKGYLHLCIKTESKIYSLNKMNSVLINAHGTQKNDSRPLFQLPKHNSLLFYGPNHLGVILAQNINNNHIYNKLSYWNNSLRIEIFNPALLQSKVPVYFCASFSGVEKFNKKLLVRNLTLTTMQNEDIDNLTDKTDDEINAIQEISLFQELHKTAEPNHTRAIYDIAQNYEHELGLLITDTLPAFSILGFKPKNIVVAACRSNELIRDPKTGGSFLYEPSTITESNYKNPLVNSEDPFDHLPPPRHIITLNNEI